MPSTSFLQACRRESVETVPVWFMRQAGRYMPEYRALRVKHDLLTLCKTPELAIEVTLQPVRAMNVDAAILFSDLLIPLEPMGVGVEFAKGEGPVLHRGVAGPADVERLRVFEPAEELPFTLEAIRGLRRELKVPLIGFAGAPFTLASYLIEGGSSRRFEKTKLFMAEHPQAWSRLMEKLAAVVNRYLKAQEAAGAQAVQLFDSWVGCLSDADYRRYALPWSRKALEGLRGPRIHFGVDTSHLLESVGEAGSEVVGVDWREPLERAFERLPGRAIQGNLDPVFLMGPRPELERRVRAILETAGHRPGYIFNLGHGILPGTPPENVRAVADMVHEFIPMLERR